MVCSDAESMWADMQLPLPFHGSSIIGTLTLAIRMLDINDINDTRDRRLADLTPLPIRTNGNPSCG